MGTGRFRVVPTLLVAAAGVVVGLAVPAAAHEASSLVNGRSIELHSIPSNRMMPNTLTGKQINESTLGTVPRAATLPPLKWHPITAWLEGWGPYDAGLPGLPAPAYAIDAQGMVHLEGEIMGGIPPSNAFAIPAALVSPPRVVWAPIVCDGTGGSLSISGGYVYVHGSTCSNGASLDGVSFNAG
jgi:hypothetical protein